MLDARFSHLYFCQSLNRLQRGFSAIAELLVLFFAHSVAAAARWLAGFPVAPPRSLKWLTTMPTLRGQSRKTARNDYHNSINWPRQSCWFKSSRWRPPVHDVDDTVDTTNTHQTILLHAIALQERKNQKSRNLFIVSTTPRVGATACTQHAYFLLNEKWAFFIICRVDPMSTCVLFYRQCHLCLLQATDQPRLSYWPRPLLLRIFPSHSIVTDCLTISAIAGKKHLRSARTGLLTIRTKDNDRARDEVSRSQAQSSGTVYQPLGEPKPFPSDVGSTSEGPPLFGWSIARLRTTLCLKETSPVLLAITRESIVGFL